MLAVALSGLCKLQVTTHRQKLGQAILNILFGGVWCCRGCTRCMSALGSNRFLQGSAPTAAPDLPQTVVTAAAEHSTACRWGPLRCARELQRAWGAMQGRAMCAGDLC